MPTPGLRVVALVRLAVDESLEARRDFIRVIAAVVIAPLELALNGLPAFRRKVGALHVLELADVRRRHPGELALCIRDAASEQRGKRDTGCEGRALAGTW